MNDILTNCGNELKLIWKYKGNVELESLIHHTLITSARHTGPMIIIMHSNILYNILRPLKLIYIRWGYRCDVFSIQLCPLDFWKAKTVVIYEGFLKEEIISLLVHFVCSCMGQFDNSFGLSSLKFHRFHRTRAFLAIN